MRQKAEGLQFREISQNWNFAECKIFKPISRYFVFSEIKFLTEISRNFIPIFREILSNINSEA